jgi:peptidoglycan biosynthesis protein MviN/MurJ (putative lipid II flippase)
MVGAIYGLYRPLEWWVAASFSTRILWVSATIIACVAAYFATLLLTGTKLSQFRLRVD